MKKLYSYNTENTNPFKWRKLFTVSATFVFILIVLASCKKEQTTLGKDAINSSESLISNGIDTFSLATSSFLEDSVESSVSYYNFLGSYNDPVFGTVNTGFFTQIRLSGLNPNFGDLNTIQVDSLVLGLKYAGTYGDFTKQTLEVHRLTENLYLDSNYYGFSSTNYDAENLVVPGKETFTPDPISSIYIDTVKHDAQLRIHLKTALATEILQQTQSNPSDFVSQTAFNSYLKGFYVKVNNGYQNSGTGGVLYLDTKSNESKMTIYYKLNGVKKTFDFIINGECADYNKIDIARTGNNKVQQVLNTKNNGQVEYYAQANGIKGKIEIPGIENIHKNSIIHKAELEIPIQYQTGYKFDPGYFLRVQREVAFNSPYLTNYSSKGYYDDSRKAFIIDIRVYVQEVVSKMIDNTGIIVSPDFYTESMDRIIFNGPNSIKKRKPKLTLKFTEF